MKQEIIPISDLEKVFKLLKLEQTLRVQLHSYKEHQQQMLQKLKECKQTAEALKAAKQQLRDHQQLQDKQLNKEMLKILNKQFKGGTT